MDLRPILRDLHTLADLPRLVAALGHEPEEGSALPPAEVGAPRRQPPLVVGRTGEMPWVAVENADPERAARRVALRLAARGRLAVALALDPATRRIGVAVALDGAPALVIPAAEPSTVDLRRLEGLAAGRHGGALTWAVHAAQALRGEFAGRQFFLEFRATLERMAAGLPGPLRSVDRQAYALLQLTRVLFLYFVQAKGWLDGRERFLPDAVDHCLARRRHIHRDLLRPLFFGTLNRPRAERSRAALEFGAVPFLNGGLFEPHPLERRIRADVPNDLWRDAFDGLFERFHFTVAEGVSDGRIAPDMLGRVFEGVMAPDARRATGTYYTPSRLVGQVLEAALVGYVAHRTGRAERQVEHMLAERHPAVWPALEQIAVLDPAAGSGAFLLGALERLAALSPGGDSSSARRRVLRHNLFGVDRSAGAVRLTELRLWLAVIAADPTERPDRVPPLPNLDSLVRQGDSLFEPITAGLRPPPQAAALVRELAAARREVVESAGPAKRSAWRRLVDVELRVTAAALEAEERTRSAAVAECLRDGHARDLFGQRRGLDRGLRERLAELRRTLHEVRRARRALGREREVPWFHYQCQFADVFARGGFDIVIGNPPWLRAEEVPSDERRRLAGRYRWWVAGGRGYANRPDLAVAFLERAMELAAPEGVVALLVPAKLATAGYGAAARHALASGATLLRVADLSGRPEAAFEATVYPLALVIRASRPPVRHRVRTALLGERGSMVPQHRLRGGGPWIFTGEPARRVLEALAREHPRLDGAFTCRLGLKTGANAVFLDPPDGIEPELLRRAIRGRDVQPFSVASRRRLLYPYGPDGRVLPALPPGAAAHLAAHDALLRRRADYAGGPPWTLFRTGAATAAHRVVWPDLARRLTAAALTAPGDRHLVPLNTCYVVPARSAPEAERLAAWLNSSCLRAAASAGAVPAAGGFARFTASAVGALPLPAAVLACEHLSALAAAGRRGTPVQDHLDELTAGYLGLSPRAVSVLRALLARGAGHRG